MIKLREEPENFGYHNIERMAMAFVLETETWETFLTFVRETAISKVAEEWANGKPDLSALRIAWAKHSPNPIIRNMADVLEKGYSNGEDE